MILRLDWYNPPHNVLVLHSCNRLAVCDPFLVPFCPVLYCVLGTHHVKMSQLDPNLAPQSAFCR